MTDHEPISEETSFADMERRFSSRLAASRAANRAKYFGAIPSESLLWMALAPSWTLELALACDFPAGGEDIGETFDRMAGARMVEVSRPIFIETLRPVSTIYTMKETMRAEVLSEYQDRLEKLRDSLTIIGQRMVAATESPSAGKSIPQLLPQMRNWALLARSARFPSVLVDEFDEYIDNAFEKRDSAEILNWIETGRRIANVLVHDLDSPINIALQQAGRKVELLHRRKQDDWHLQFFLEREEQVKAFETLMTGDDTLWALHYIGAGAMGKTMLMRYITANLADRFGAAVARIDFDYLSADYPSRSPGLLVWSFAQELRAYDPGTHATRNMDRADKLLRKLQQELQSNRQGTRRQTINDPLFRSEFQEVLALYIEALRALSRPVILILDTCEELAKTRPEGVPMEDVEETFKILRALHDGPEALDNPKAAAGGGLPSLRVIFAGRRPLAREGYKWRCPTSRLPARPYLRLHQLRGFPHKEARNYLRNNLKVREDLIPPIIQQSSPDGGDGVLIKWKEKADRPSKVRRCNPYILRLYADWAKEDPPPSAEDLANATDDKFVELRIVGRLRRRQGDDKLVGLLPAVALLRHFDQETLQAVSGVEAEELESLFERLREQEWVSQRLVSVNDGKDTLLVLDLEPVIQQRLLDYYSRRSSDLSQVWERAADYLERVTLQRDLAALDWSFFDAALRVLEARPERAVVWWGNANERFLSQRDFTWIGNLTRVLTGADGAVGLRDVQSLVERHGSESPLRLDVLATSAAAFLHTNAKTAAASAWQEIAQKAKNHPVPAARVELQLRALAGGIATSDSTSLDLRSAEIQTLWQEVYQLEASTLDAQVAAALVAAAETVVEHAEELTTTDHSTSLRLLLVSPPNVPAGMVMQPLGPVGLAELLHANELGKRARQPWRQPAEALKGLQAFAATLAARALVVTGEHSQAQYWFQQALSGSRENDAVDMSTVWADWLPPDNLAARVRLEFIRASYPAQLSPGETLAAVGTWQGSPTTTDTERLRSAMLRLRMAEGPVPHEMVLPEPRPRLIPFLATCYAHRETPTLFATSCEMLAANGYVDEALPQLRVVSQQSTSFDLDTIRNAERALLRIIRRMRLRDEHESGGGSLVSSGHISDQTLLWALEGLDGGKIQIPIPEPPPTLIEEPDRQRMLHAIWRTRYTLDTERMAQALHWANAQLVAYQTLVSPQDPAFGFHQASLYLDLREAALLSATSNEPSGLNFPLSQAIDPSTWWLEHPEQPAEALTLWLRILALESYSPQIEPQIPTALVSRLGQRRAAEIALDEGELLGLRLPEWALIILELAATWFAACSDPVGVVLVRTARVMILARRATVGVGDGIMAGPGRWQELNLELAKVAVPYASYALQRQSMAGSQQSLPLPSWQDLATLGSKPDEQGIESLGPPAWRPWLVRLIACLIREERIRIPGPESDAEEILRAWLTSHYGSTAGERVELPADFAGWFAASSVPLGFAGETAALTDVAPEVYGGPKSEGFTSFRLDISSAFPSTTAYRSPTAVQAVNLHLVELLPGQEQATSVVYNGQCQTIGTAPYRTLANNLPAELSMALQRLGQISDINKLEVIMRIEAGLEGPCWEAAIALAVKDQLLASSDFPFRFRRMATGSRGPRNRVSWPTVRILSCAANEVTQNVARRGWGTLIQDPFFTVEVRHPSILSDPSASLSDFSLLHLIGTAEETTAGIRFRCSEEQAYLRQVFEAEVPSSIGDLNPSDTLIRAADLARILPSVALCIIQGAVDQELAWEATTLRGEVDRRDAILARMFALELHAQGIPVVLVIPPLVPQSGVSALERIAAVLQSGPQSIGQAAIDALANIQALILRGADSSNQLLPALQLGSDSEAVWERALDACLYIASGEPSMHIVAA